MKTNLLFTLAAGLIGSFVLTQVTQAQTGNTGGSGGRGNAISGGGQNGSSSPLGGMSGPGGLSIQSLDFSQGSTAAGSTTGATGGATGGRTQRRTGSRTNSAGSMGMMGMQGGNLNMGRGGAGSMQQQTNRQAERRAQYSIRLDLGPTTTLNSSGTAAAASPVANSTLQVRTAVERSVTSIVPAGTNVTMDGSSAIISGVVSSSHDRQLIERMALLIPGVDSVRNELVVQGQ